jgi:hypothetical protein
MRRWTLAAAAAALLGAALWHLPATAQRTTPAESPQPTLAAAASAGTLSAGPAAAPAAGAPAATLPVAPELITFDEYRDFRMRGIAQSQSRLARELASPGLTAADRADLERRKAYYDGLAAMPAAQRDQLFRARFDQIDTNHDGMIDNAERTAWREKQREHYRELAAEHAQQEPAQH